MQFAVIAYVAGIGTGVLAYWAIIHWIPERKYQVSERAVHPKQPLRHWPTSVEPSE